MAYFSDREHFNDRTLTGNISVKVWNGIASIVNSLINNNNLARDYPRLCLDGNGIYSVDEQLFYAGAKSIIPTIDFLPNYGQIEPMPLTHFDSNPFEEPSDSNFRIEQFRYDVLDFIEFVFKHINDVRNGKYHDYYNHYELIFLDTTLAKEKFVDDINEIFYRNNTAFKLCPNGEIQRIIDKQLNELIEESIEPQEETLCDFLDMAKTKIKSPKLDERQIALEKLWDAFERIKTVINPKDKNKSSDTLLDMVADGNHSMKVVLDNECRKMTKIGNNCFIIRHSESDRAPIEKSEHLDYLFFRMYSLVQLLLTKIDIKSETF